MDAVAQWLLDGPPWVQYRTRVDLLKQPASHPQVIAARAAMLADPQIQAVIARSAALSKVVLSSHKSAGHPLHHLVFLADLGLDADDPGMDRVLERLLQHQSAQGPFQVLINVPVHFGGTGRDAFGWALCDTPLVTYALMKFGFGPDPRVQTAMKHLSALVRDNGFPCAVSPELGTFRGPGRKDDPCPYANLVMLQALAQIPKWRNSQVSHIAVETLLAAWAERRARHPYLFYMGTDFSKLKAPLVWYDLLHVLDVLTQFPWARADKRLQAMVKVLQARADREGRFMPESIWTTWAEWEFGQKRAPSPWITFVAQRILKRAATE